MVTVHLPDGSTRQFDHAPTGAEVAADIGAGLAKAAIAMKINGTQRDLSEPLADGEKIELVVLDGADHFFRDLYSEEIADVLAERVGE